MTTVLLHSTQPVMTAGFQAVLNSLDGFALSCVCSSIPQMMERIEADRPHLLLIEISPAVTLDLLRQVITLAGNSAVVLWVDEVSTEFASQAIAMGIRGLLRKSLSLDLQAKCLRKVSEGEMWVEKALSDRLLASRRVSLTTRERQLMGLLAQGLKNKEIAHGLGITEGTVKVYLARLFQKVDVKDRFELALFTLKNLSAHPSGEGSQWVPPQTPSKAPGSGLFVPSFMTLERTRPANFLPKRAERA